MIRIAENTIDDRDIDDLREWISTYPRLTQGPLTKDFENQFADWLGTRYAVFVNSGSSAILLALYTLIVTNRLSSKKIVVPGLSWATDLAPVMQFGLNPRLCDCNLSNLSVDLDHLERLFRENDIGALLLVSVLGLSPDMDAVIKLCEEYNVILLEDACESAGTMYKDKKLGSFGLMSFFSFYFGHHISTIEGGMICTNDEDIYHVLLSLRSHGWGREWKEEVHSKERDKYKISGFDSQYTFYYPGFNLRSTSLQSFLGINQLRKIDKINKIRNDNFKTFQSKIQNDYWKPVETDKSFTSNMAYPIVHPQRDKLAKILMEHNIECRPLICGSMGQQPFYTDIFGRIELSNCDHVKELGLYIPNHHSLSKDDLDTLCNVVNSVTNG